MIVDYNGNPLSLETKQEYAVNNPNLLALLADGENTQVAGMDVSGSKSMRHSTVYACIRVISEALGQLKPKLFKIDGGVKKEISNESSQLSNVLTRQPNDFQTWNEFLEQIAIHLCVDGNFYAYVNRNSRGVPVEIIPFLPSQVSINTAIDGSVYYDCSFGGEPEQPTEFKRLTEHNILHIRFMTFDGLHGMSPIAFNRGSIGLSMAAAKHGEQFFTNSATPNGIIRTEKSLSEKAIKRLKQGWNNLHKGVTNSNKLAVLEDGLEFQQVSISNKDSQFLETRKYQRSEICGIFRVPLHMIGDLERATFSNIEEQSISFYRDSISPYIEKISARINRMLNTGKHKNYHFELDYSHLIKGDTKAQIELTKELFSMGALTLNEVREMFGLEPFEKGGDQHVVATNNYTFGKLGEKPKETEIPKNEE
ncbi:Phage portal protein [Photobacterium marinum]|uniref:Phage portal protein n=1 Tax=Photobacterium marinum TaxID=1056511 RepID=L8JB19_9GAMM|nr:phage portal protein [Photobacterium marinum]ELR66055.1 Phage portal protein [Photobacterium marinum]